MIEGLQLTLDAVQYIRGMQQSTEITRRFKDGIATTEVAMAKMAGKAEQVTRVLKHVNAEGQRSWETQQKTARGWETVRLKTEGATVALERNRREQARALTEFNRVASQRIATMQREQRQIIANYNERVAQANRLARVQASLPTAPQSYLRQATQPPLAAGGYVGPRSTGTTYGTYGGPTTFAQRPSLLQRAGYTGVGGAGIGRRLGGALVTSAVFGGIYGAYNKASQTYEENYDVEKRIGEIQTISQEAQMSTDKWRESVTALSVAYGKDVKDQLEAVYQTISNQIAKGDEAIQFVASANKLARATVSTTSDAVNLLSSVINAYGVDVNRTDEIAAKLFKTVELGRIRISDFANSFGPLAIIASRTGVSMEQLFASIQTLTIQGQEYNKTATQMRGLMVKLLKPTDEMQKLFRSLGVEDGPELLDTYGDLSGALRQMSKYTGDNLGQMAKLVPRARGLIGVLGLTADQASRLADNIEKTTASTKSYDAANEIMSKNLYTRAEQNKQFRDAWLRDSTLVLNTYWTETWRSWAETLGAQFEGPAKTAAQNIAEANKKAASETTVEYEKQLKARTLLFNQQVAKTRLAYYKMSDAAIEHYDSVKGAASRMNSVILSNIVSQENATERLYKNLQTNINRIARDRASIDVDKAGYLSEVALTGAKGPERIRILQRQIESMRRERSGAFSRNDYESFSTLSKKIIDVYKQIGREQQKLKDSDAKTVSKQAEYAEKRAEIDRKYAAKRAELENRSGDSISQRRSKQTALARLERQRSEALLKIKIEEGKLVSFETGHLNVVKLVTEEYRQWKDLTDKIKVNMEAATKAMQPGVIDRELKREELSSVISEFRKFKLGKTAEKPTSELVKIITERAGLLDRINKLAPEFGVSAEYLKPFKEAVTAEIDLLGKRVKFEEDIAASKKAQLESTKKELEAYKIAVAAKSAIQTTIDVASGGNAAELKRTIAALKTAKAKYGGVDEIDKQSPSELYRLTGRIMHHPEFRYNNDDVKNAIYEIARLTLRMSAAERITAESEKAQKDYNLQLKNMEINLKRSTQDMDTARQKADALKQSYDALKESLKSMLGTYSSYGKPTEEAPAEKAFGGYMRGNDMIPAMLRKGEMVMNADVTSKLYSQLMPLNGRPSTLVNSSSTSIGDVNVTVQGSNYAPSDARALATEFKRLAKRGLV